jgi:1-acyl-sn-glycerol-3-phosphate acyltransferase
MKTGQKNIVITVICQITPIFSKIKDSTLNRASRGMTAGGNWSIIYREGTRGD